MSEFELVSEYIQVAQRANKMEHLEAETEAAVRQLGFDYFAILHHLDLDYPGAEPGAGQVRFSNYPAVWREAIQAHRLVGVDPVLAASQRTAHGFLWSDVPAMIDLSPKQKNILDLAERAGLGDGFTVPAHIPGEYLGSSSFGLRLGRPLRKQSLPMLQYLGSFAFEAGRRIVLNRAKAPAAAVKLTERQLDCIVLAGRGEPASRAAKQLGIKQDTFQKHMSDIKLRLGVRTTTQAVIRSLFDGRITFKDVIEQK